MESNSVSDSKYVYAVFFVVIVLLILLLVWWIFYNQTTSQVHGTNADVMPPTSKAATLSSAPLAGSSLMPVSNGQLVRYLLVRRMFAAAPRLAGLEAYQGSHANACFPYRACTC